MSATYALSLHIFRRDLRLQDNSALIAALSSSQQVIVCFILDDRQITDKNAYKSKPALQFMLHSLQELRAAIEEKNGKLYIFSGIAEEVVAKLIHQLPIEAVFVNRDYTIFSKERDRKIEKCCADKKIDFHSYADALLHEPEQVLKADKTPYTIYTPAARHARQFAIDKPTARASYHFYNKPIALENDLLFQQLSQQKISGLYLQGGRKEALKLLEKIKQLQNYKETRDFPNLNKTSHLSAHNKFGTVSVREVYWQIVNAFGTQHTLTNELYWRDFFTHIAFHFPRVFKGAFLDKFKNIKWSHNEKHFTAWCNGMTGFPIVDAGMRELNATGYMHNRVRMIVASFLCKDLHINWQEGEKYFAHKLVDYDPAVNNGNWQWAASTGCDAQPYFRIFNPWLQQEKFDQDCLYIKHWIPELSHSDSKSIHRRYQAQLGFDMGDYPLPIVDHAIASSHTKSLYKP